MWEFLPRSNYLPLPWEPREGHETQFNYCTFYLKDCPVSWTENSVPQGCPWIWTQITTGQKQCPLLQTNATSLTITAPSLYSVNLLENPQEELAFIQLLLKDITKDTDNLLERRHVGCEIFWKELRVLVSSLAIIPLAT